MVSLDEKKRRIHRILTGLGRYYPRLEAAIIFLDDDTQPSQLTRMAKLGYKISDGATNRQLLDGVAALTGESKIDRESRDYVQLPLREVGILAIATASPDEKCFILNYWKPKSNNCVYVLEPEFRALLRCSPTEFDNRIDDWLAGTSTRKARLDSAEAAAWANQQGGRLVPATQELYCPHFLPEYEVIYVDDRDGDRIAPEFQEKIMRLRIPLDLSSRWPDLVLVNPDGEFWIIDCVENDGEVDYVRRDEMTAAFNAAGHTVAGYTTAYRNLNKFAERQKSHDNIADGTYVWIMEIGGSHWKKELPPPGDFQD